MVVTAPTKEKAFEEIITSLRVKAMYDSKYNPKSTSLTDSKEQS